MLNGRDERGRGRKPNVAEPDAFGYVRDLRLQACILTRNREKADLLVEKALRQAIAEASTAPGSIVLGPWLAALLKNAWESENA